VIKELFKN